MCKDITIAAFFKEYNVLPIIDVRSPGEFAKGHIPGAVNIPLFSDDERADVGTVYKQQGQEAAIALGLKYVTPKLETFVAQSEKVAPLKKVVIHCWRGGMRSHAFAEHLEKSGFDEVRVIKGGYKAFRNLVLDSFDNQADLKVIGGFTGSGKTYLLSELKKTGCQVVDLEAIANHKGSAFGGWGTDGQPTVEQFENNLFQEWRQLDFGQPVFIEDESHNIGAVKLPMNLYQRIRNVPVYFLDIPKKNRAAFLVNDYSAIDNSLLEKAILKIAKRLGGLNTQNALKALAREDYFEVAMLALNYYDKSYLRGVSRREREKIIKVPLLEVDAKANARIVKSIVEQ